MSPMTNESNTESSYPELVSSQSDVALSSIDTESLALSQDSDTLDIWGQLPVRKYTDRRTGKINGNVMIAELHLLIGI